MRPGRVVEDIDVLRDFMSEFLESVHGALIVLDDQWRITFLNGNADQFFEIDTKQLIGAHLKDVFPKLLGRMLSPEEITNILKKKDKSDLKYSNYLHKWFRLTVHKSNRFIFIMLEDITAEQLVNRLLRLNEYSVSLAKDMIYWLKTGGHIIYSNASMQIALGYTSQDIAKMKIFDIDLNMSQKNWLLLIPGLRRDKARTVESTLLAADGHKIPVEVTWNYLYYLGEEYIMAFARDITARKKVEKELLELKAEAELYVDLMGHDINNMNQVALGYLELALDMMRTEGRIDNKHIEMLEKPRDMLLSSSKLIDNVRKIQREKAGSYKTQTMDIGQILREVRSQSSHVSGRDLQIELEQDGECRVAANELLMDIFINLVGNSIKHSKGPLLIRILMSRKKENNKNYCQVAVEDNGPGIPDDIKQKLLNRFEAENTRARGKGLGLYLIKQLVDDFNGHFWMEDRVPGDHTKGARFVVMLPVVDE